MSRGRPPVCLFCGSVRSIRKGRRKTKYQGIRQIRQCRDCGRKFTPRHQKGVSLTPATETATEHSDDVEHEHD